MIIEITRPRGQSVTVELGQAIKVIEKYQAMMTLGFKWSKCRIACWKDLQALEQQKNWEVGFEFGEPRLMQNDIKEIIQRRVEQRRRTRHENYVKQINALAGLKELTQVNHLNIYNTSPQYRGREIVPTVGRIVKVKLQMSPYDVSNFAREMQALVKKYSRTQVKRGWTPSAPAEVAERYLKRIKT